MLGSVWIAEVNWIRKVEWKRRSEEESKKKKRISKRLRVKISKQGLMGQLEEDKDKECGGF